MPTYDYLCPNGHRFEVIHSVTAEGPETCPVCGAAPIRKAFTAPTIHFKGTGWAKKDRSATSRSHKPAASSEATTASSDDAGGAKDAGDRSPSGGAADATSDTGASTAGGSASGSTTTTSSSTSGNTSAAD